MLLTYDRRLNTVDPDEVPAFDSVGLRGNLVESEAMVAMDFIAVDGSTLRLCDFASTGEGGSPHCSWLRVVNAPQTPFSRENPLRSGR